MDKIDQVKPYGEAMDFLFKDLYNEIVNSQMLARHELPNCRGIYVFYEGDKAIYVGRANNIKNRIYWHTRQSSGSESASFAFNLAKLEYPNVRALKRRRDFMQDDEFIEIFKKHKLNLAAAKFRCITIENDIIQTMFEPYLAFKLGTYPLNNTFENH